jgi:hypothetical protein
MTRLQREEIGRQLTYLVDTARVIDTIVLELIATVHQVSERMDLLEEYLRLRLDELQRNR